MAQAPTYPRTPYAKCLSRFIKDESGATAIEYSLIAAGIACTILGALFSTSDGVGARWNNMAGHVSNALAK